jgi:hypothetical protein
MGSKIVLLLHRSKSPWGIKALFGVITLLLLCGPSLPSRFSAQVAPEPSHESEQVLRARIKQFYDLLEAGNWSKAENYVAPESLDTFRNQTKTPIRGYDIDSVKLAPQGQSATVVLSIKVTVPYSPTPYALPRSMQWRLVGGKWYAVIPEQTPATLNSMFQQGRPPAGATPHAPSPVELQFEYGTYTFLGPLQPGQVKVAHFPFKNVANHAVKLGEVTTGCKCVLLKGEKREFMPGEPGSLDFEVNPDHHGYGYGLADTVTVKTEPGGAVTYLTVRTYVAPLATTESKSEPQK